MLRVHTGGTHGLAIHERGLLALEGLQRKATLASNDHRNLHTGSTDGVSHQRNRSPGIRARHDLDESGRLGCCVGVLPDAEGVASFAIFIVCSAAGTASLG